MASTALTGAVAAQPGHQPDGAAGAPTALEFRLAAPQVALYVGRPALNSALRTTMHEPLSETYDTPELHFRYPARCTVAVYTYDPIPSFHRLVLGVPGPNNVPFWINAQPGFGVTTGTAGDFRSVADMIAAGKLRPPGGADGLVERRFAGEPALWRDPGDSAIDITWVFMVAHGLFRSFSWSRSSDDPLQQAILGSIVLGRRSTG